MLPRGIHQEELEFIELDKEVNRGRWALEMSANEIKKRFSSANWLAGLFTFILVITLITGTFLERVFNYWQFNQTCAVVRTGDLTEAKLAFLSKHCVGR